MRHLWIAGLVFILSCATYDTIKIGDLNQTAWVVDGHYVVVLPTNVANLFNAPDTTYRGQEAHPFYFDLEAGVIVYLIKEKAKSSKNAPILAKTIGLLASKIAEASGGPVAIIERFNNERVNEEVDGASERAGCSECGDSCPLEEDQGSEK